MSDYEYDYGYEHNEDALYDDYPDPEPEPDVDVYEHLQEALDEPDQAELDRLEMELALALARMEVVEMGYGDEQVNEDVIDDEHDIDDYEPDDDPDIDDYEPEYDPNDDLDEPPDDYDCYADLDDDDYGHHHAHRCPSPPPAPPPPPPDPLCPDSTCAICLHALANTVLIPCGHLVACSDCCDTLGVKNRGEAGAGRVRCPMCRAMVTDRVLVFRA